MEVLVLLETWVKIIKLLYNSFYIVWSLKIHRHTLDLNQFDEHPAMLDACFSALGQVDMALTAHVTL